MDYPILPIGFQTGRHPLEGPGGVDLTSFLLLFFVIFPYSIYSRMNGLFIDQQST